MRDAPGRASDLWAITCYFDPGSTRRRLANYRVFRRRLGMPLVTVELVHGATPDLGEGDADILLQIRGDDVLWQKERLLNLALKALPATCSKVAWIDGDVVFADDRWQVALAEALETHAIVQPYDTAYLLPPGADGDAAPDAAATRQISIASVLASGIPAETCLVPDASRQGPGYAFGHAWAARRALLDRFGLYDACIIGGGDRAMICAAQRCFDVVMDLQHMTEGQRRHYLAWAEPFGAAVDGSMGFLPGAIHHLWHGSIASRAYHERHAGLAPHAFDPVEDLEIAPCGAWRWKAHKPAMWRYVSDYFTARDACIARNASP